MRALVLVSWVLTACSRAPLSVSDGDLARPFDLSYPSDLANLCDVPRPNAKVPLDGVVLTHAALGNVDQGGEGSCGGDPEGVRVTIARDARFEYSAETLSFELALPVAPGVREVKVWNGAGASIGVGTVDITRVRLKGSGPGLEELEGILDVRGLGADAWFSAVHCPLLDRVCV